MKREHLICSTKELFKCTLNFHVSHALSKKRDLCYFVYAMYFGYQIYIYIFVYNFTINQCIIIIIVIPAMYEVIPFEKGILYRKM